MEAITSQNIDYSTLDMLYTYFTETVALYYNFFFN
jgi:hypothetical protein